MRRLLTVIAAMAVAASACSTGGTTSDGVASLQDDEPGVTATTVARVAIDEAALEFSRCMRDNGIDLPDIAFDPTGGPAIAPEDIAGIDLNSPEFTAAFARCIGIIQRAGASQVELDPALEALIQDQLQDFSACMRANGVAEFPDPDFIGAQPYPISAFLRFGDEDFQQALEACRDTAFIPGLDDGAGE